MHAIWGLSPHVHVHAAYWLNSGLSRAELLTLCGPYEPVQSTGVFIVSQDFVCHTFVLFGVGRSFYCQASFASLGVSLSLFLCK
jgi:hypothetical protein